MPASNAQMSRHLVGIFPEIFVGDGDTLITCLIQQLRDFADYAHATNRALELWVRPTTKVASTVFDAGWEIFHL